MVWLVTNIFQSNLGLFSSSLLGQNEILTTRFFVLLQDSSFCVEKLDTGLLCLKQKHSDGYYEETQICMGLWDISYADFVYYTVNGLALVRVNVDKEYFQKLIVNLNSFYKNYVVPLVLKKKRNNFLH